LYQAVCKQFFKCMALVFSEAALSYESAKRLALQIRTLSIKSIKLLRTFQIYGVNIQ
jgi:hypothetical protein